MRTSLIGRLFNGLAILAMLMNALAPSLSQAQATAAGSTSGWMEICSTQGSRWVKVNESGDVVAESTARPDDAPPSVHQGACGYCLTHAGSFALLPPAVGCQPQAAAHSGALAVAPQATIAPPARAWAVPAVRAPPRLV